MRDLKGKTAFVTGGASGFGLEFARAFLKEGMRVALADIEAPALAKARDSLQADDKRLRGFVCDTADRASLQRAADGAIEAFGRVHLVCNNAGVGGRPGSVDELPDRQWNWVLSVNLMGVVHGISVFLPHMRGHGEGGHFLNTASMAGMLGQPHDGPYSASKAAVIGISESLYYELRGSNIGVSVLCPGFAKTGIALSERAGGPRLRALLKLLNVPAVVDVHGLFRWASDGDIALLDGDHGLLVINPSKGEMASLREYRRSGRDA